jgi:hypothetical protein
MVNLKGAGMKARLINLKSMTIRGGAAAVFASAALLAMAATPAEAFTVSGTGSPGAISFAPTVSAQHYYPYSPSMVMGATAVNRSPAYPGTQTVTVVYAIFSNAGGTWGLSRSSTRSLQLPVGYSGTFPALKFGGLFTVNGYQAMIFIQWKDSFGAVLGTRLIEYDGNADYRCFTSGYATCTVYNNYDGAGAFVGFGMA